MNVGRKVWMSNFGGDDVGSLRGGDLTTLDSLVSVGGKCGNTSCGPL